MEKFLLLKKGMTVEQCQKILGQQFELNQIRQEHFKADEASFPEGVRLFFNIHSHELYTLRFDAPFALSVGGVFLGSTKKEVKNIKGQADRIDPFPFPKTLPTTIWMYGKLGDWLRYDFEKERNGKCITIYI